MNFLAQLIYQLFAAAVVLELVVTWIFLSRLRRLHPETWKQLDEPTMSHRGRKFRIFLWRKEFNSMPDDRMVVIGRAARWLWLCRGVMVPLAFGIWFYTTWDHNPFVKMFSPHHGP
jgi:hypothetical protein